MKHSTKIICLEIGIIIFSFFCSFSFHINSFLYLGLLALFAIVLHFFLKPAKRVERFDVDIILITIISILFYYALTYFIGFFSGFYYSSYSKRLLGILYNLVFSIVTILSIENIRETLIRNNYYHKSIIFLTPIITFLLEIPMLANFQIYTTKYEYFNAFLTLLLPCFIKHITLTYILCKSSKKNTIVYQLLLTIPKYFLPVFPNLGDFFDIVINCSLPVIILVLVMNISTFNFDKIKNSRLLGRNKILIRTVNTFMILFILVTLYLASNMFRFAALAIGSKSMQGSINKGDVVILDKKDKYPKKGDVMAFQEQGKTIVHRVIQLKSRNGERVYITKGDANNGKDNWILTKDSMVGKVKFRVRWIGWPTVALSEMISKNNS